MTTLEEALAERYEDFTSTLCFAAQYGSNARREQTYLEVQKWIKTNQEAIAAALDPAVAEPLLRLFDSETLQDLLNADKGDLIGDVGRISEALYR